MLLELSQDVTNLRHNGDKNALRMLDLSLQALSVGVVRHSPELAKVDAGKTLHEVRMLTERIRESINQRTKEIAERPTMASADSGLVAERVTRSS